MYLTSIFVLFKNFIFLKAKPQNKNSKKINWNRHIWKALLPLIQIILPAIYLLQISFDEEEFDGLMIGLQVASMIYWVKYEEIIFF